MLTVNSTDVERLLPMEDAIEEMERALRLYRIGAYRQQPRLRYDVPGSPVIMGAMAAYRSSPSPLYAVKLIAFAPENAGRGLDTHQGVMLLQDGTTGLPLAMVEASSITRLRTAAVSAVATRALARADAQRITIVGLGRQAPAHIEAMRSVRPGAEITLTGRRPDIGEAIAARYGVRFERDIETAVRNAEIVCTLTSSATPVIARAWIAQGCHINAVGAHGPTKHELDRAVLTDARFFIDCRMQGKLDCREYALASALGAGGEEAIGELGDVLDGQTLGRTDPKEITVFKSLGLAVEDLAAAALVLDRALPSEPPIRPDCRGI